MGLGDHLPAYLSKHKLQKQRVPPNLGPLQGLVGGRTPLLWPNHPQEGVGRLTSTGPGVWGPDQRRPLEPDRP